MSQPGRTTHHDSTALIANIVFVAALAAYLGVATTLLYRNPTAGWGFPMFVFVYPVFLVAYFIADTLVVAGAWLLLAIANMPIQDAFMKREKASARPVGILIGPLLLWPIQFAAAINSSQTSSSMAENKNANRQKIGTLPASVRGTVSYTHHHGTEEGHDSVWLEEYGDLDFMTDSKTYDQIGIAEGRVVTLNIEEREAPDGLAEGKVLWITGGTTGDPE